MAETKLTAKREAFCTAFVETGNQSEAYRRAFDAGRMKAETIHKRASELMCDGNVTGRIAELQAELRKRHNITVDSLTIELDAARAMALANGNASAAVSATMAKARLHGFLGPDRPDDTGKDGRPVEFTINFLEAGRRVAVLLGSPRRDGQPKDGKPHNAHTEGGRK